MKTGILLINTGTPDVPEVAAIQSYLREFLLDPFIISMPRIFWKPILSLFILPRRPKRTAVEYQKIWTEAGSPFMLAAKAQSEKLGRELDKRAFCDGDFCVQYAMRYGNPSIKHGLRLLREAQCERVVLFPLYPQQVKVCTGTCLHAAHECLAAFAKKAWEPDVIEIPSYYDLQSYSVALADSVRQKWNYKPGAKLLFSFHSTLVADIKSGDPYQKQIEETVESVVSLLGIAKEDYEIAYQSRFDNRKWLQPSVKEVLRKWAQEGVTDVCAIAPGFSVDCLESLVELAQNEQATFLNTAPQGATFTYVPALNDCDAAISVFADAIERACLDV